MATQPERITWVSLACSHPGISIEPQRVPKGIALLGKTLMPAWGKWTARRRSEMLALAVTLWYLQFHPPPAPARCSHPGLPGLPLAPGGPA